MNKLTTILAATALAAAPMVALAAPASAGSDKVTICHATSAANGHYNLIEVAKDATAGGHAGHQDGGDIIPAYSWVEKGTRYYFDGQNLDKAGILANGCKLPATPGTVTVNAPTYVPASCARPDLPYGQVTIPADKGQGIASATAPVLNPAKTLWSTAYALTPDTESTTYAFPAGVTGVFDFTVVPLTADPMYVVDSKTGQGGCEMPETGAKDWMIPAGLTGAGLILAGAVLARRRTA